MNTKLFKLPEKLLKLQNKLWDLRRKGKFLLQNGDVGFGSAPSNIALVKYWGKSKTQLQIPDNPSLSFTLNHFRSNTKVTVLGRFFPEGVKPDFIPPHEFYLSDTETQKTNMDDAVWTPRSSRGVTSSSRGVTSSSRGVTSSNRGVTSSNRGVTSSNRGVTSSNRVTPSKHGVIPSTLSQKLNSFLENILFPFATDIGLKIESENNFPTACGIASSASGMAALCAAIANLLNLEKKFSKSELQYWLAEWSRLGSGSAIRSACVQKNTQFVSWELRDFKSKSAEKMTAETTVKIVPHHKKWDQLRHCVFILNSHPKDTTSSEGHALAYTSPLHEIRVNDVKENFDKFKKALKNFDFEYIASFTENDAFMMHAVMQTSIPPVVYLNHQVSFVIAEFIQFRQKQKLKAFWTLDAGPNIHFLYLAPHRKKLMKFLKEISVKMTKNCSHEHHPTSNKVILHNGLATKIYE